MAIMAAVAARHRTTTEHIQSYHGAHDLRPVRVEIAKRLIAECGMNYSKIGQLMKRDPSVIRGYISDRRRTITTKKIRYHQAKQRAMHVD